MYVSVRTVRNIRTVRNMGLYSAEALDWKRRCAICLAKSRAIETNTSRLNRGAPQCMEFIRNMSQRVKTGVDGQRPVMSFELYGHQLGVWQVCRLAADRKGIR
jgi:hypothetical protein